MTRFERHPVLTLLTVVLMLLVAFLAAMEWLLAPSGGRDELIGRESDPRPPRVLVLREWEPNTRYVFGPPETRLSDSAEPVPEVYVLETDAAGFIEPSIVHAEADGEIVFVGGSTTECLYVLPENRFPHLAARLLEARLDLKINGINAGKSGNNTMLSLLATIGKVVERKPDFVVLMHATNDIGVLNRFESYWNDSSNFALVSRRERSLENVVRDLRDMSVPYTYRGLRRALDRLGDAGLLGRPAVAGELPKPAPMKSKRGRMGADFESALRSFVAVVRAWHSQPVLMTQIRVSKRAAEQGNLEGDYLSPEALAAGNFTPESFAGTHAYFNAIIRHVALSEGVPLIDLAAARDWSDRDVYDGLHFNDTGSRRAADAVAEAMAPLVAARSREP